MAELSKAEQQRIQQLLSSDPELQRIAQADAASRKNQARQASGRTSSLFYQPSPAMKQRFKELGVGDLPGTWVIDWHPQKGAYLRRNQTFTESLGEAAKIGGPLLAVPFAPYLAGAFGAVGGGAAAAGGGAGGVAGLPAAMPGATGWAPFAGGSAAAAAGGGGITGALKGFGKNLLKPDNLLGFGKSLSDMAAGRAEGRAGEADYLLGRDAIDSENQQALQRSILDAIALELDQRKYADDNYQRNVGNALHGGLLQGVEDVTLTPPEKVRMGSISGGLKPSALVGRENIGREMQREAMLELLNPTRTAPINYGEPRSASSAAAGSRMLPEISVLPKSKLSEPPQPNLLDKFLNIAGPVATAAGTFLPMDARATTQTAPAPSPSAKTTQDLQTQLQNARRKYRPLWTGDAVPPSPQGSWG